MNGRIILKCIIKNCMLGSGLVASDSGSWPVMGFFEHSNKCLGYIQHVDFLR